jgi:hypothetical protein
MAGLGAARLAFPTTKLQINGKIRIAITADAFMTAADIGKRQLHMAASLEPSGAICRANYGP